MDAKKWLDMANEMTDNCEELCTDIDSLNEFGNKIRLQLDKIINNLTNEIEHAKEACVVIQGKIDKMSERQKESDYDAFELNKCVEMVIFNYKMIKGVYSLCEEKIKETKEKLSPLRNIVDEKLNVTLDRLNNNHSCSEENCDNE